MLLAAITIRFLRMVMLLSLLFGRELTLRKQTR